MCNGYWWCASAIVCLREPRAVQARAWDETLCNSTPTAGTDGLHPRIRIQKQSFERGLRGSVARVRVRWMAAGVATGGEGEGADAFTAW